MEKHDITVSLLEANVYGLLFGLAPAGILVLVFYFIWRGQEVGGGSFSFLYTLLLLAAGIIVHELLHGVGWIVFAGVSREDVHFGVKWKLLTPYAHSSARMPLRGYRWAGFLPGLVLGLIPAVLGIVTGSVPLLGFGVIFTVAAGGDFLILWMLRNVPSGAEVEDHPTLAGAMVYY